MNKKVVYIGNFSVHWTTENQISKSFKDLGWEVVECQEDRLDIKKVINECKDADFLLWTRTWIEFQPLIKNILNAIDIPTVSWHLDLYWGLDRESSVDDDLFWRVDYVFTADGGHQEEFKAKGINHYYLSPGVYKPDCYQAEGDGKYSNYDIAFLGAYYYHGEHTYRSKLIDWLKDNYKFKHINQPCWGECKNKLFADVKIMMGDSCFTENGIYWSDRVPEHCGRGAFLIHPRVKGLEQEYPYYETLIPYAYNDFNSLRKIIDYYLKANNERNEIKANAVSHTREHHNWERKIQTVLNIVGVK